MIGFVRLSFSTPHACSRQVNYDQRVSHVKGRVKILSLPACVRFYGRLEFETDRIPSHILDI